MKVGHKGGGVFVRDEAEGMVDVQDEYCLVNKNPCRHAAHAAAALLRSVRLRSDRGFPPRSARCHGARSHGCQWRRHNAFMHYCFVAIALLITFSRSVSPWLGLRPGFRFLHFSSTASISFLGRQATRIADFLLTLTRHTEVPLTTLHAFLRTILLCNVIPKVVAGYAC